METIIDKLDYKIEVYERKIKRINEIKKGLIDGDKKIIIEYRQNIHSELFDWILQTMKEEGNINLDEMHKIANEELEEYDDAFGIKKGDWKEFPFHRHRFKNDYTEFLNK
jgi:hypothetical protein